MHHNTLFVGMDVHKESFTLCCYSAETENFFRMQKISPDSSLVIKYSMLHWDNYAWPYFRSKRSIACLGRIFANV